MTDEELIAELRKPWFTNGCERYQLDAADRIEALVKERAEMEAEAHAHTKLWRVALREKAQEKAAAEARAERLEAVLRELIDHTHNCEKELTERLYRADFCGESLPLTNARAALNNTR